MNYLILLTFLVSLVGGCVGNKVVTEKAIRELGKNLHPRQKLIYRRVIVEETLEITKTNKVTKPRPHVKKKRKKKEAPENKARFYQISH